MFLPIFNLLPPSPKTWTMPPSTLTPLSFLIRTQANQLRHYLLAGSITTKTLRGPPLPRLVLCKAARPTRLPSPPVLRTRQATRWIRTRLGTSRSYPKGQRTPLLAFRLFLPLFTEVRGIGILRTSPFGDSRKSRFRFLDIPIRIG